MVILHIYIIIGIIFYIKRKYRMIFYSSTQLFNTLSELCKKHILMGNYHFFHGTFSSKNVRTITDIDITDYYEIPSTNALNHTTANSLLRIGLTVV